MERASILENLVYNDDKLDIKVLLKTTTTKEIRIVMKEGQTMKEHQAPFPIVVELFEGSINFGVNGTINHLERGDIIALDANVPHDLFCTQDCIIRLSLSISDSVERVKNI